jgi:hypothetical protein
LIYNDSKCVNYAKGGSYYKDHLPGLDNISHLLIVKEINQQYLHQVVVAAIVHPLI